MLRDPRIRRLAVLILSKAIYRVLVDITLRDAWTIVFVRVLARKICWFCVGTDAYHKTSKLAQDARRNEASFNDLLLTTSHVRAKQRLRVRMHFRRGENAMNVRNKSDFLLLIGMTGGREDPRPFYNTLSRLEGNEQVTYNDEPIYILDFRREAENTTCTRGVCDS